MYSTQILSINKLSVNTISLVVLKFSKQLMDVSSLFGFSGSKTNGSVAACLKIWCFQRHSNNSLEGSSKSVASVFGVFHFTLRFAYVCICILNFRTSAFLHPLANNGS